MSQFIEFLMNGQQLCLSKNNEIRVGFWFGSLSFSLPLFVLKNVSNSLKQNEGQHKHIVNFCFVLSISVWSRYAASGTFMRVCDDGWMNLYDNCTPICFMLISLKEITLSLDCYTSSTIKFEEWTLPRIFVRTSWFIANLSLCMQNVFLLRKLNNEKYSCLQFEKPISHIFRRPNLFDPICFKVER